MGDVPVARKIRAHHSFVCSLPRRNPAPALGTTMTAAQRNSGNSVSNCNIFNFYVATIIATGMRLQSGTTDGTITGNSFYQTASRAAVANTDYVIMLNNASGNNFTVTRNFIGGDSAQRAHRRQPDDVHPPEGDPTLNSCAAAFP